MSSRSRFSRVLFRDVLSLIIAEKSSIES